MGSAAFLSFLAESEGLMLDPIDLLRMKSKAFVLRTWHFLFLIRLK
jgi:hypothetical protein